MPRDAHTLSAFEHLWQSAILPGGNSVIAYDLAAPKWQFLCYLADTHGVALHGSGVADIAQFEPRQAIDHNEFGAQKAVYAAGDGIWPMYYAILDRARYPMTLCNACIRVVDASGQTSEPLYLFSISKQALVQQPWHIGMVYILPPETFMRQPSFPFGPIQIHVPQLASPQPVTPLARLQIGPMDFPFLAHMRGHDDARLGEYAAAMANAAPWPDD